MVLKHINYAKAYFEFPVCDRIHGKPTYSTLKTLKKQLKANATAVVSDLGGGQHGQLGLVLPAADYALISNVPYVRPVHPGLLVIPNGTAHHEAVRLQDEHHENIRLFCETNQVEKALLIKQIVASVDREFLEELCDKNTNTINMTVPEILDHLSTHYGLVDSKVLNQEDSKLKNYMWNINDPPIQTLQTLLQQLQLVALVLKNKLLV